ncbi:DUF3373 family protein [Sulfurimonas sp. CVO]|uniref:DUF3373 domain-containing protein n=1 Tax=Sulfurimonas xiamenensis TaxID=2590021 RepID=A0AAJ4A5B3_9BACT|nr:MULTISPECIES: DUF3373 family protein [Sulfurimonas]QFR44147.1 DUF3373 domain-containing protein [Sulfurimonas xiamenensis]QHG92069.1 DUF3373 family protein [Sulfurimonas sp. CVO]
MKKIVTLSAIAFLSTAAFAETDVQKQIDELNMKIERLQQINNKQDDRISDVNILAAQDNLKFDVDFRTAYDNLQYETVNGNKYENDALFSNRLWLGMGYAPTKDMIFRGQLSVNKAYGASYGQRGTGFGFDTFDWVLNENLTDDTIKLREAYWLWKLRTGRIGWTVSAGRRPATNGYLINLRDDDKPQSPLGHIINMEFDGASASMQLEDYIPGMYFKLCIGRGLTNATGWASEATKYVGSPTGGSSLPNYVEDDSNLDNTDMVGLIFQPYDDGQYGVITKFYRGFDVPGLSITSPTTAVMKSFGDMDGAAISFKMDGVGDEINDFLDDTILFASFAASVSRPNDNQPMMGSQDDETGTSIWIGAQMPNLTGGKFGVEYNHGSKYWRPFTYGEDTMIGSKMAVRGNAYEAYWTQPLVGNVFSMQIRYTYLDYDYTGSNGFFGDGGTPISMADAQSYGMDPVETAQDLRVYFRYRY